VGYEVRLPGITVSADKGAALRISRRCAAINRGQGVPTSSFEQQPVQRVCVAVPTFRRPVQLAILLRSLAAQNLDSSKYELRFVVIDNDISPTAESIVADAKVLFEHSLAYVHMPEPGLSVVRNAALEYSAGKDDLLAMIDDDEVPETFWLSELLRVRSLTNADAVIGPVPTSFPPGTPAWVKQGRFFELPRFKDCAELHYGITGNCLLAISAVAAMRLEFDKAFGLSGGEDTLFFRQMLARGGKIVYAAKAIATEFIPLARTDLRYIATRKFRNGNTHALCELQINGALRSQCVVLLKGFLLMTWSLYLLLPRVVFFGRAGAAKSICDVSRAMGKLAAVAGFRFLGYSRESDTKPIPSCSR
jgi:succinoglycan biosynthesis protein ExoM